MTTGTISEVQQGDGPVLEEGRPVSRSLAGEAAADAQLAARSAERETPALWLGLIVVVALSFRVLLFVLGPAGDIERSFTPEGAELVALGERLVLEGQFAGERTTDDAVRARVEHWHDQLNHAPAATGPQARPEGYHLPGYALLTGLLTATGLPLHMLILLQCVIVAAAVVAVYAIARAVLGTTAAGLGAAAVFAVHPLGWVTPLSLTGDAMVVGLVVLGIWPAAVVEKRRLGSLAAGGLAIGLASLIRPAALVVGPVVAVWLVLSDRRLATLGLAGALLAGSLLPAGVWLARNEAVGYGPRLTTAWAVEGVRDVAAPLMPRADEPTADTEPGRAMALTLIDRTAEGLEPGENLYGALEARTRRVAATDPTGWAQLKATRGARVLTDHAVPDLYARLGIGSQGVGTQLFAPDTHGRMGRAANEDPTTLGIELGWLAVNVMMVAGTMVGLALLAHRRRWQALALLGGLFVALLGGALWLGSGPGVVFSLVAVQAMIVGSLLLPAPPRPPKRKRKKRRWFEREVEAEKPSVLKDPSFRPI